MVSAENPYHGLLRGKAEVDLRWKDIDDTGAIALAKAFESNRILKKVDVSFNKIGGVGGLALIESLVSINTLTEIALSCNELGNDAVQALAKNLKFNTVIQIVKLSSNNITVLGGLALVEALLSNNTITEMHLSVNDLGDEFALFLAEALQSNRTIRNIYVTDCNIGVIGAEALTKCLSRPTLNIQILDSKNGDLCAQAFVSICKDYAHVTEIDLSHCVMESNAITGVCEALSDNTSVTNLKLSVNKFGDNGCTAIGEMLKVNKTLKHIDLGFCHIGDGGAKKLAYGLMLNTSLNRISLAGIEAGIQGACALVAMVLFKKDKNFTIHLENPKHDIMERIVKHFGVHPILFYKESFNRIGVSAVPLDISLQALKSWMIESSSFLITVVSALLNDVDMTLECLSLWPDLADKVLVERSKKSGLLHDAIHKERRENAASKSTSRASTEAIEAAVAVASAIKGHDITLVNIHLCGDGCAGKSMTKRALQSTLNLGWFSMLPSELKNVRDVEGATLGSVCESMDCTSAGGKTVHLLLHDYGGQEAFQVNHAGNLAAPRSAYIIVVALCDASTAVPYVPFSRAHIVERYTAWLKFIYSAVPAGTFPHCVTVINFIQQFQQATSPVPNFTLEDVVADITAVQAAWTSKGKLNFQERPPLQLDVNVPRQAYDILAPVLKSVVEEVCSAPIPMAPCLQALRAAMADEKEWPLFSYEPGLFVKIRTVIAAHFTPSQVNIPIEATRGKVVDTITSITQRMLEAHRDIMVFTVHTGERISINRPNWLTNQLLGSLFDPLHRKHVDKALPARATNGSADPSHLLSVSDIQEAVSRNLDPKTRSMLDDTFIPKLLQHIGVCIPVVVDGGGFVQGVAEGEDAAAVEHWFPAFSVTPMKDADGAVLDNADHIVARLFRLEDPEFSVFPPGYFSSLFVSIVSLYNKTRSIQIFKNGMVLRTRAVSSVALQQIVVRQSNDLLSFVVTVATTGTIGTTSSSSLAFMTMQKIKKFIFSENSWKGKVQVQECGLDPEDIARSNAFPVKELIQHLKEAENLVYYFGVERAISGRLNAHVIDTVLDKLLTLECKVDLVLDSMQSFRKELSESLTALRKQISELQQLTWQSLQGLTEKLDASLVRAEEARVETKQDLYTIIDSLARNLLGGLTAPPPGPLSDLRTALSQSASATASQLQDMRAEMLREVCKLSEDLHGCVFEKLLAAVKAQHTSAQQETRALFLTELNALHNAADASQEAVRAQVAALQAQLSTAQSIPQAMYTELLALRESVQAVRSVQLDSLYGVYDTPLLLSLTQPAAADSSSSSWDVKGRLQRGVYELYRLHFVCPCCGNKAGEGYELKVTKGWVGKLSKVLRCTLTAIKVVSFFTPFPVPMLDKLVEYLPRDLGALDLQDLLEEAKKVVTKGKKVTDKLLAHGRSKVAVDNIQSSSSCSSTSSTHPPTPPPSPPHHHPASDTTPAAIVEPEPERTVITMEHVASVLEVLQMVKETSPPRSTGLAVCRTSRGQCAWVCQGEGGADSACKTRFMAEGSECLAFKLTLG